MRRSLISLAERRNHYVKDAFSKSLVKWSVPLQPSEEQGFIQRVDQQLWIRRRLQFAGRNRVFGILRWI